MRRVILAIMISSLVGCSTNMGHHNPTDIKQALNNAVNESSSQPQFTLPPSVSADLMPALANTPVSNKVLDKRFRINAKNVDANVFFTSLVKGTPFNIVIDPNVKGRITMKLKDVTLDNVLDVASDIYGYHITRQGNIIQVFPASLRTDVIPVNYLQLQRKGVSLTSITTGSTTGDDNSNSNNNNNNDNDSDNNNSNNSNNSDNNTTNGGTTIETTSKSDFWAQLEKVVSGMIGKGDGRNVMVSPQAGLISVRAYPNELREVKQFLGMSQTRLTRQVVLEAKIMEVTLDDSYQQGIDWNNLTSSLTGSIGQAVDGITKGVHGAVANIVNGQANITITDGNFNAVMSFLSTQGDLNVLSSPRVTAANNQKAVIKVGGDEYFVTNISSSNVSGDNSSAAPDIKLTPFFSGISLDVTPQIDDKGGVLLHVHPVVVDVKNDVKSVDLGEKYGTYQLPLAKSTIRESDSIIHARSGDVVVIGGLMKTSYSDQVTKVPLLGDIPVLGNLFRHTNRVKHKTELVILLKPTVVTDHTWQQEIERSRSLINQWFPDEA
jgi:MSHA biogenesis protein MshL